MYHFRGLPYLANEKWIEVKGQPAANGRFQALEITLAADEEEKFVRIQGLIQQIDYQQRCLCIANKAILVPQDTPISIREQTEISFDQLKAGELLRIDGDYLPCKGLIPRHLSRQIKQDFNLEKLFGFIENLNMEEKAFSLLGLPIDITAKTSIELT